MTENFEALSKHLKSELKKQITTPSKRRRKISKSVEKVRHDRRPTPAHNSDYGNVMQCTTWD